MAKMTPEQEQSYGGEEAYPFWDCAIRFCRKDIAAARSALLECQKWFGDETMIHQAEFAALEVCDPSEECPAVDLADVAAMEDLVEEILGRRVRLRWEVRPLPPLPPQRPGLIRRMIQRAKSWFTPIGVAV